MGQYCPLPGMDPERDLKGWRGASDMRGPNPQEPPMARSNSDETTTYARSESRELRGTLPLDESKNQTVVVRWENNMQGREIASENALKVAGPPRVVPMSFECDTEGDLSRGCSLHTPTQDAVDSKEHLEKAFWHLTYQPYSH